MIDPYPCSICVGRPSAVFGARGAAGDKRERACGGHDSVVFCPSESDNLIGPHSLRLTRVDVKVTSSVCAHVRGVRLSFRGARQRQESEHAPPFPLRRNRQQQHVALRGDPGTRVIGKLLASYIGTSSKYVTLLLTGGQIEVCCCWVGQTSMATLAREGCMEAVAYNYRHRTGAGPELPGGGSNKKRDSGAVFFFCLAGCTKS